MKKTPCDVIILHKCTKNHDHMLYCSLDILRDKCNCYFSFWAIFSLFTPLTAQKLKNLKQMKKSLEISSFYICVPIIMIRWCTVPEIWCATDGQADRQNDGKSDIQRLVPHLKIQLTKNSQESHSTLETVSKEIQTSHL